MRLFLALRLPEDVVRSLDDALVEARETEPGLRWVPPERWHLTLAFYGDVAPPDLERLRRQVTRRLAASAALELRLAGAGRFGDRVLWIGVDGDTKELAALGQKLVLDDRPYRPHLTVARARQRADLRPAVERLRQYAGRHWTATEVELLESHLGPRPTYDTIDSWALPGLR